MHGPMNIKDVNEAFFIFFGVLLEDQSSATELASLFLKTLDQNLSSVVT